MRCGYKTGFTLDFLHSVRVKSGPDQVRGSNGGPSAGFSLHRLVPWGKIPRDQEFLVRGASPSHLVRLHHPVRDLPVESQAQSAAPEVARSFAEPHDSHLDGKELRWT
jgi:hypothetical protein